MTGLATALFARPYAGWSEDPAADIARADKMADAALALALMIRRRTLSRRFYLRGNRK